MSKNRKIYFAGSIRGGRQDADLYLRIVEQLKTYGTVLTEHVASPTVETGRVKCYIHVHVYLLRLPQSADLSWEF